MSRATFEHWPLPPLTAMFPYLAASAVLLARASAGQLGDSLRLGHGNHGSHGHFGGSCV